jgi:hypothetical protein
MTADAVVEIIQLFGDFRLVAQPRLASFDRSRPETCQGLIAVHYLSIAPDFGYNRARGFPLSIIFQNKN